MWLDPAARSLGGPLLFAVLSIYLVYSAVAIVTLRRRPQATTGYVLVTHSIDLVAAASVTLASSGPNSPLFLLFIFALVAAAFRWGAWETLATAVVVAIILVIEAALLSPAGLGNSAVFHIGDLFVRAGYLLILGLLLGYLAEETRQLRAETSAIAHLQSQVRIDRGLTETLQLLSGAILHVLRGSRLILAAEDSANGRLFRWDSTSGWAQDPARSTGDLPASERSIYWFGPENQSFSVVRRRSGSYRTMAIDSSGQVLDRRSAIVPSPEFIAANPFHRMLSVAFEVSAGWKGRMFVLDPAVNVRPETLLRFVQVIARQVGPTAFNAYLLGRLRSRAGAIERARIARELHDGVIQTLLGTELELAAMRRTLNDATRPLERDLARIQANLHAEVLNVRELIEHLRPVELKPRELPDYLAHVVERFERDSGIRAQFSTDVEDIRLPSRMCHEIIRIVQEALVNVRRHGAARHVLVRLAARDNQLRLEIDDDGQGFPFEGRFTQAELDSLRRGPRVIKERVRAIGGELTLESAPGRGATLQITVPQEIHG